MQECWDQIISVALPLTVMNMMGTGLVIVIMKCAERAFHNNNKCEVYPDMSVTESTDNDSKTDDESTSNANSGKTSDNDSDDESPAKIVTDDDLIAHVRESSVLSVINNDVSPGTGRKSENTQDSNAVTARNEIIGEQASLESMASSLISVSKKMAGTLDGASHIPEDKKQELAILLQGVPSLITRIVDMDDDELGSILQRKIVSSNGNNSAENRKQESEFLMKTLESLKM